MSIAADVTYHSGAGRRFHIAALGVIAASEVVETVMQIIGIASQKGGSGKTTLAGHLAVQAEGAGAGPVALVDTDPQGSLSEWWNARKAETPRFARTSPGRLPQDIEQMRALGIELLIIDTPPAIESTITDVINLCDLVLIPVRPSPHDLRAVGATVDIVEKLGKPLIFVVNGATPRARITNEAVMALSQHGTLAPVILHHRTGFAASMIDGRTVGEIRGEARSAGEIALLWGYIGHRLKRDVRTLLSPTLFTPAPKMAATPVATQVAP
jgi:chromosome partitioning protein